jgi:hypothetical protein
VTPGPVSHLCTLDGHPGISTQRKDVSTAPALAGYPRVTVLMGIPQLVARRWIRARTFAGISSQIYILQLRTASFLPRQRTDEDCR